MENCNKTTLLIEVRMKKAKKKAWKWEVNVCQEREISSLEQLV